MNRVSAPRLGRIGFAVVALSLLAVLAVCGLLQPQSDADQAPGAPAFDLAALDRSAHLTAIPIPAPSQASAPTGTAAAPSVPPIPQSKWPGVARRANYQAQADATPATEDDSARSPVLALPPLDEVHDAHVADQPDQIAPLPAPAPRDLVEPALEPTPETVSPENRSAEPEPAKTAGRILSPDFAAAFAVQSKHAADAVDRLAPLSGPSEPTPQLIAVSQQADRHVARGMALAERRATYTARAEFLRALRVSVAALDEQRGTTAHTRALASGFCALEEAEDFLSANAGSPGRSVQAIAAGHRSPMLHDESPEAVTAAQALQLYLNFAQDQLAAAAGDLQPAAAALYALGKLELISGSVEIGSINAARAAVYLQAALVVNPRHALAANELGVLLARHGRLEDAKASLVHSVRSAPMATAWHNLATVHSRLGEQELAGQAEWESRQVAASGQAAGRAGGRTQGNETTPTVQWVDPATFARTTNNTSGVPLQ